MRIARILTRLNLGGPARQVLASDPLLMAAGHEVRVFAGHPQKGEGDLFDALLSAGVDVRRVPGLVRSINPVKDLTALAFLKRELAEFAPDVVHTHASKAGILGRRAARVLGPSVSRVHTFHGHVLEGYFPSIISKRMVASERAWAAETDRILAVSHATADDLVRLEVTTEEQLNVVSPGVDLAALLELDSPRGERTMRGGPRELCGIGSQALLVGVVGRLAEVKQPEIALGAFVELAGRYPQAELVFVGDGEGRRDLERRIEALDEALQKRVHMAGQLLDSTAIFGDLDLLLMSSRSEGLPVALIEAHAAGIPSVATNVGGTAEVIAHERTGLVAREEAELGFQLDALLGDAGMRQVFGKRARMRVSERYSAASLARKLEAIYQALVEARCGS